jgi:hypothetical protein
LVTDDDSAVDSAIFGEEITDAASDPIVDLASLALRASLSCDSMDLSLACKLYKEIKMEAIRKYPA